MNHFSRFRFLFVVVCQLSWLSSLSSSKLLPTFVERREHAVISSTSHRRRRSDNHPHHNRIFTIPYGGGLFGKGGGGGGKNDKDGDNHNHNKNKKSFFGNHNHHPTKEEEKKKEKKKKGEKKVMGNSSSHKKNKQVYPALTNEEIQEWLEHIPVFALTHKKSNTDFVTFEVSEAAEKNEDDETDVDDETHTKKTGGQKKIVSCFFMCPKEANDAVSRLTEKAKIDHNLDHDDYVDLKVSVISLGTIWSQLFDSSTGTDCDDSSVPAAASTASSTSTQQHNKMQLYHPTTNKKVSVEYRLFPENRDRLSAQMLLTMNPETSEKLKTCVAESMGNDGSVGSRSLKNFELAKQIVQNAVAKSPKFNTGYNEIPIFLITQLNMKQTAITAAATDENNNNTEEPMVFLPIYFNFRSMVKTWLQFINNNDKKNQTPEQWYNSNSNSNHSTQMEPTVHLSSLHELIGLMQKESTTDWRSTVLVPSSSAANVGGKTALANGGIALSSGTSIPPHGGGDDGSDENNPQYTLTKMINDNGNGNTLGDI